MHKRYESLSVFSFRPPTLAHIGTVQGERCLLCCLLLPLPPPPPEPPLSLCLNADEIRSGTSAAQAAGSTMAR